LYPYLMTAAALVWRARGSMSWNALTPLFAAEYGLTLVAAYGIFRIGIGRVMSVVATLALLVSAIHLAFLPYLRDYSKAPFVLGLQPAFNESLGFGGSIYDWGYFYNDGFANRTINSFTYRREGHPVAYISAEYDRAMVVFLLTIARHWPADMAARAYGAALKV